MNVKRPEDLREVADETLAGLEAGPALRHRILSAAQPQKRRLPVRGLAIALSFAVVLAVVLPIALRGRNAGTDALPEEARPTIMNVVAAGGEPVSNERASLYGSQLTITQKNSGSAYGLWDGSTLIRIDGRCYRMIRDIALNSGALDGTVASIEANVDDISLSDGYAVAQGVPAGTAVYGVRGVGTGAMVACEVNGQIRGFQRVSYAGNGRIGGESLRDVMPSADHVIALSLTGCDVVEGEEARRLYRVFLDNAQSAGSGSVNPRQVLLIVLDNGAVVQLAVDGERFGGCGTWSCPELIGEMNR